MSELTGRAAIYQGVGKPLVIREFPVSQPGAGEALLSLESSGICGTDLHIIKGRLGIPGPLILGHEFLGRIEAIGSAGAKDGLGRRLKKGDAAIACVAIPCGACFSCLRGETASCLKFGVTYLKDPGVKPHFFGGYAEFLYMPLENLIRIPDGVSVKAAAAYPCAGPTIIRACSYAGGLEKGELVVVQGTGPVGLFAIAWAAKAGCTVVAIGSGSSPHRLKLAKSFGAKTVLDYKALPAAERAAVIKRLAAKLGRGDGADVVIEASGSPSAVPEGVTLLRTRGRYLIPGQYSASGPVTISPEMITFRALQLIGSGQYTLADLSAYLDFLKKNPDLQRKFAASITHSFTVDQAEEAMATVDAGQAGKAVFVRK
jgi:D-arabinose 1-dehydrogenase-like Zn-dependent alcohol dehydrogenase